MSVVYETITKSLSSIKITKYQYLISEDMTYYFIDLIVNIIDRPDLALIYTGNAVPAIFFCQPERALVSLLEICAVLLMDILFLFAGYFIFSVLDKLNGILRRHVQKNDTVRLRQPKHTEFKLPQPFQEFLPLLLISYF